MAYAPTAADYAARYNRSLAAANWAPKPAVSTGPTAADYLARYNRGLATEAWTARNVSNPGSFTGYPTSPTQWVGSPQYQPPAPLNFGETMLDNGVIINAPVDPNPQSQGRGPAGPGPTFGGQAGPAGGGGGLDPSIVADYARAEALRRLRLKQLKDNTNLDLTNLGQSVDQARVKNADQYNRQLPTVASSFLARGLASSGITNTGIARYHQDYRTAASELDTTYAQARAKLLKQIADAEAEASTGSAMDALNAGDQNWQSILNMVAKYS